MAFGLNSYSGDLRNIKGCPTHTKKYRRINMTSKERAYWRGQANGLQALFQVGKGGISDALIKQTDDALKARELIKIKVLLETSPEKPKEIAQKLAEATNSDCVGVIGGSMIFYRYNPELHKDEKKKAKGRK